MRKWLKRQKRLSVIVVVHNMAREAPRTLYSLSTDYQRDIVADDYEVLVVDNGSQPPLDDSALQKLAGNFRYIYHSPGNPSPVAAINAAALQARGEMIGVLIDGARLCSPGLLAWALRARAAFAQPVVATLNWHLGPSVQNIAITQGYTKEREDQLLAESGWQHDGYALHRISALGGSSAHGYFLPVAESNGFFITRKLFEHIGGYDEGFVSPGGGLANLDIYKRACETPHTNLVVLLGEGTFHQLHGGVMTNIDPTSQQSRWQAYEQEYRELRGSTYEMPTCTAVYMGTVPDSTLPVMRESALNADLAAGAPITGEITMDTDIESRPGAGLKPGDSHYRAWVGPPENYDILAAVQFSLLTELGLRDYHRLLDIGCGSLRAGRLFIPYLLPDHYYGIEPELWLIEEGIRNELGQSLIDLKRPRFAHNQDFDFSVFGCQFDFMLAQSVLTHAGRSQIQKCFLAAARALSPQGLFAFTYIPAAEDHPGDNWVYPELTGYTRAFMIDAAKSAGLELTPINWRHPGVVQPRWLVAGHSGLLDRLPADMARDWLQDEP